ncbi:MAG: tetratricopeptide repeat protein, partial [Deinococcales bacterium]
EPNIKPDLNVESDLMEPVTPDETQIQLEDSPISKPVPEVVNQTTKEAKPNRLKLLSSVWMRLALASILLLPLLTCSRQADSPLTEQLTEQEMQESTSLMEQATKAQQQRDFSQAQESYQAVLKRYPNHIQALYGLAYVKTQMNFDKEAMSLYMRVLELDPDYTAAHDGLSKLYLYNHSWKEAIDQINAGLSSDICSGRGMIENKLYDTEISCIHTKYSLYSSRAWAYFNYRPEGKTHCELAQQAARDAITFETKLESFERELNDTTMIGSLRQPTAHFVLMKLCLEEDINCLELEEHCHMASVYNKPTHPLNLEIRVEVEKCRKSF